MRILILNQFYPPDRAPTGQVAHDLARFLRSRGHEVVALASRRGYMERTLYPAREVMDGVAVERVWTLPYGFTRHWRKLLSYGSFYMAAGVRLMRLRPRPDVVIVLTTPPYVGLLVRLAGLVRGWRRVHWVMDLYPDVMVAHGMFGGGVLARLVAAALRWLTRRELAGASAVLTLGPDMAARLGVYTKPRGSVEWVPLWAADGLFRADESAVQALRQERGWDGKLVLLYSGNMGLGHRFGEFLAAAGNLGAGGGAGPARRGGNPVRFVFAGAGRRRPEVDAFMRRHPGAPVELRPYAPAGELAAHLRSADVLLASLDPAWAGCMLPSKLQGMFAAGRPVLFVGPEHCSLARWIEESGAGWVVAPGDGEGLAAALAAAADPEERRRRGAAAQAFARAHFDRGRNCARIAGIVERGWAQPRGARP